MPDPDSIGKDIVSLDIDQSLWERFYTIAPLVVIGTKEQEVYDLAPKHMAMPIGWQNYYGFVCTPRHSTYHNVKKYGAFTVSYPWPDQVLMASLAAAPRCRKVGEKPSLRYIETITANRVDGVFLKDAYLYLECNLDRIVDGFGTNSLIIGEVVAAHVHEKALRTSGFDDQELLYKSPLLAFLAPDRFASIAKTIAFPYPSKFEK